MGLPMEEGTDRRERKGRCCCLGDVLECSTSLLAARMIEQNPFWEGAGLVWCELDDNPIF